MHIRRQYLSVYRYQNKLSIIGQSFLAARQNNQTYLAFLFTNERINLRFLAYEDILKLQLTRLKYGQ